MSDKFHEIYVDEEKISEMMFNELVKEGYAPTKEECEVIASIIFDYLVKLSVIDDITDLD